MQRRERCRWRVVVLTLLQEQQQVAVIAQPASDLKGLHAACWALRVHCAALAAAQWRQAVCAATIVRNDAWLAAMHRCLSCRQAVVLPGGAATVVMTFVCREQVSKV